MKKIIPFLFISMVLSSELFAQYISGPGDLCNGSSATYTFSDDVQYTNTYWSTTGGGQILSGSGNSRVIKWTACGTIDIDVYNGASYLYTYSRGIEVFSVGEAVGVDQVCAGTTVTLSRYGGYGFSFTWHAKPSGSSTWTSIGAGNSVNYTVNQNTDFKLTLTNCSSDNIAYKTVSLYPAQTGGTISSDVSAICYGSSVPTIQAIVSPVGRSASFQWQRSTNGGSTWSDIAGATGFTYTPGVLYQTTYFRRKTIGCGAEEAYSNSVTVQVDAPTVAGSINAPQTSFTVSGTVSLSLWGNNGTITNWQVRSRDEGGAWSSWSTFSTANVTAIPYNVISMPTVTRFYEFRASVKNGTCSEVPTSALGVTVSHPLNVSVIGPSAIPVGGTTQLSISNIYQSYQWVKNNIEIPGATSSTLIVTEPGDYIVKVRAEAGQTEYLSSATTIQASLVSQSTQINYKAVTIINKPGFSTANNPYTLQAHEVKQAVNYLDGLGRVVQQVAIGQTPARKDIVQPYKYDFAGRMEYQYLPYTSNLIDGRYRQDAIKPTGSYISSEQYLYYNSATPKVATDNAPYAKSVFESSPLSRVIESGGTGTDWQPGTGHTIREKQLINLVFSAGPAELKNVKRWTEAGPFSIYGEGELLVNETTDENNNKVWVFTDKWGRTILKRAQLDETIEGVFSPFSDTYYVYDTRGNLVMQIPPQAAFKINNGTSWSTAFRDEWCFVYTYDERNRLIEKKVPGAASAYYLYDPLDRLVLVQDGNLRSQNKWAFIKYDRKGRAVMQGVYTNATQTTRAAIQLMLDDLYTENNAVFGVDLYFEDRGSDLHGYTNRSFPKVNADNSVLEVLSINYFDNHDFDNDGTNDFPYTPQGLTNEGTPASSYGLMTGSKQIILGTSNWLYAYVFYDKYGRPIQARSNNHLSLAIDNLSTTAYNFDGSVERQKLYHNAGAGKQYTVVNRYNYDHAGRLLETWHKVNDQPEILVTALEYNELGQVVAKKLHQTGQSAPPVTSDPQVGQPGVSYAPTLNVSQYNNETAFIANNTVTLAPGFYAQTGSVFTAKIGYSQQDAEFHNAMNSETALQTVDYRYNIRGWLTHINNSKLNVDANNADTDDYFGMEILYNNTESGLNDQAGDKRYWNGNISAIKWKGVGSSSGAENQRSYKYDYDKSDKLKAAKFQQRGASAWNQESGTLNESMTYDHNGNIKSLQRTANQRGLDIVNSIPTVTSAVQTIDDLTYTYASGNQVNKVEDASGAEAGFRNGQINGANEYVYNTDGSLTEDENKGITAITYNVLGKPQQVTFNDGRTIAYTYDASGNKLSMAVTQNSTTTTTAYVGGFVYENGNLSFFGSPGGRIVKNGANFEYQYAIADHQGNTRVVFSSVKPTPQSLTATFEGDANDNIDQFQNVDVAKVVASVGANHTTGGIGVIRMNQTYKTGSAKSLKVFPGDKIDMEVWEYHEGSSGFGTSSPALTTLITSVAGAFGGSPGGTLESQTIYGGVNSGLSNFGTGGNQGDSRPAAYLNYILFDKNMKVLDAGWQLAPSTTFTKQKLSFPTKTIKEAGYIYVYLSYEDESNNWVYFDDFKVTHTKSNVIQYNEYYPFGLSTANSWTRENTTGNNFLYNAGAELNNTTGDYNMFFRNYDPALGRMNSVDPKASKFGSLTPYNYAFNDPVTYNDPLGDDSSDRNWRNSGAQDAHASGVFGSDGGMYGASWNMLTYGSSGGVGESAFGMYGVSNTEAFNSYVNAVAGQNKAMAWVNANWGMNIGQAGVTYDVSYSQYATSMGQDDMWGNEEGTRFSERGLTNEQANIWIASLNPVNGAPKSIIPVYGDAQRAVYWAKKGDWSRTAIYGTSAALDVAGIAGIGRAILKAGARILTRNSTQLYRAVSKAELDDIARTGLRNKQGGYETSKLFAPTLEEASKFGKNNFRFDGVPNTLIRVDVPSKVMKNATQFGADGMNAVAIPSEFLRNVKVTHIYNFSPF